jgi:hypothetical protein
MTAAKAKAAPKIPPEVPVFEGSIDQFITLFLCGLVLKGKTAIWIRGSRAGEERRRMYALHMDLNKICDEYKDDDDRNFLYFLVRLRNELSPGNIGGFDGFYGQVRAMMTTIISVTLPYCDTYDIDVGATTARSMIENAELRMRELAEKAVEAYMADLPKR